MAVTNMIQMQLLFLKPANNCKSHIANSAQCAFVKRSSPSHCPVLAACFCFASSASLIGSHDVVSTIKSPAQLQDQLAI